MLSRIRQHILKDRLLQHGALLMVAAVVAHVCNIAFQMVMGRTLKGEEYALLCAMLGFANMVLLPLGAVSAAINHSTSLLVQQGREGDIARLVRKWLLRISGIGLLVLIVCLLFPIQIAAYFHLDRTAPVIIMGLVIFMTFSSAVVGGAVNGLQMFGVASVGLQLFAIVRLVLGATLIHLIAAAAGWGLMGHAIGLGANLLIMFVFLWRRLHGRSKSTETLPSIRIYVLFSFIALMAFAVLMRADIILVKHYLPDEAAIFAYATTIGHIVIFLPMPLARAMFPKVASAGITTADHLDVLKKSLFYTAVCVLPAAIGCSVLGWIPLRILFDIRNPSDDLLHMVSAMGWVMLPVALLNIILFYILAQRQFAKTLPVIVFTIFYLGGVALYHESLWNIITVAGVATWGCLICYLIFLLRKPFFRREA